MSLTEAAYTERMWGDYPVLRKALENKRIPDRYFGNTSASDNVFEAIQRLMKIAVLTSEYQMDIKEIAVSIGSESVNNDLRNLEGFLESASSLFKNMSQEVRKISSSIHQM